MKNTVAYIGSLLFCFILLSTAETVFAGTIVYHLVAGNSSANPVFQKFEIKVMEEFHLTGESVEFHDKDGNSKKLQDQDNLIPTISITEAIPENTRADNPSHDKWIFMFTPYISRL
jgi:hypothetical protein